MKWKDLAYNLSLRRHWYETLTPPGRIFVCAMIFCSSAFFAFTPVLQLLLVFLSVFVVAGLAGLVLRPKLMLSIRPPAFAECDREVDVPVWVRNDSSHSAWDISLELMKFPRGWVRTSQRYAMRNLAPNESAVGRITLTPTRRGLVRWPQIDVVTNFPFNLFRFWRAQRIDGGLTVLPRFHRMTDFRIPKSAHRYGGSHFQQSIASGEMREYAGSREYQPGVAVRKFDYASWARLGSPVVREFTDQNKPAASIVVDTCGTMAHPGYEVREACYSLAAAIGDGLATNNYPLSWFAVGLNVETTNEQPIFRQRACLMESLALAKESKEDGLITLSNKLDRNVGQTDVIYFVTPTWDHNRERFRDLLGRTGATIIPIFVVDGRKMNNLTLPEYVQVLTSSNINAGPVKLR